MKNPSILSANPKLPAIEKFKSTSKINLGLWIKEKRPDGFHELETIFFENESFFDEIEIELFDDNSQINVDFIQEDFKKVIPLKSNVAYQAASLFFKALGVDAGCNIKINKRIPLQAGLGGGSSNAACVLKGLNKLFSYQLHETELLILASKIGSDVPFFIKGKTCFGRGRGEIVNEIENNLKLEVKIIQIENISISTKWAYEQIDGREFIADRKTEINNLKLAMKNNDYDLFYKNIFNDFEKAIFSYFPALIKERNKLFEEGYKACGLCGSGSALFGLRKSN